MRSRRREWRELQLLSLECAAFLVQRRPEDIKAARSEPPLLGGNVGDTNQDHNSTLANGIYRPGSSSDLSG